MGQDITVVHTHGESVAVTAVGTEIFRYVYRPDPVAYESRKPYAHPLRTLAGNVVTGYRPSDHRWHKGLQMTASHLSGQNFWGGHSYIHGAGYLELHDQIGWMRHEAFPRFAATADRVEYVEALTWIENGGTEWAREQRSIAVHSVDTVDGSWALDWAINLTNVSEEPLCFGSPTTAGRPAAGYTGLHWRGPRDQTGADVFGPEDTKLTGEESAAAWMGRQAPWLAVTGVHDGVDARSTLVFVHGPANDGAIHPSHWFVRSQPIPTVACSWAFHEEFELPPGESFEYSYRVIIADGGWDRERVERYLAG